MIADMTDNFIPVDEQPWFLAEVSYYLALAIYRLTEAGGILPEGRQKAGEEATAFAFNAVEMRTQLHGTESAKVAGAICVLGDVLEYFNSVGDNEVPHLLEQAIAIYGRVEGSSSPNVATVEYKLANAYYNRARRAHAANDLDREVANLKLDLCHRREAARIYKAINQVDKAKDCQRRVIFAEELILRIEIARADAAAAATAEV